jgi:hypothetical protein
MEDVTTIYIFDNYGGQSQDVLGMAIAEDGRFLASHLSSSRAFMLHDMGVTSNWKHERYDKAYPDGWRLEVLEDGSPVIEDLGEKNRARADE